MLQENYFTFTVHYNNYYDVYHKTNDCSLPAPTDYFLRHDGIQCWPHKAPIYEKNSMKTLEEGVRTLMAVMPFVVCCGLTRILIHRLPSKSLKRFFCEFFIINVPVIYFVTDGTFLADYFVTLGLLFLMCIAWRNWRLCTNHTKTFRMDKRSSLLTLTRATAYVGTSTAILAVDFSSFPLGYRKSRHFGASVMDLGIGFFVFIMGMVAKTPRRLPDYVRLCKAVIPILLLGLARTVALAYLNYKVAASEYGEHLNAFSILGITKLLGSIVCGLIGNDEHLLLIALLIIGVHEGVLSSGLSELLMDDRIKRKSFWTANREGLSSIPGFIALYIGAMAFSKWLRTKERLSYDEMLNKLNKMLALCICGWCLTIVCIYTVGVARVTCNLGYTIWVSTIVQTVIFLYMIIFDLWLNIECSTCNRMSESGDPKSSTQEDPGDKLLPVPELCEVINMNGLVYFLISNVLCGLVNLFFDPQKRDVLETLLILFVYMFLSTGSVFILYRRNVRIA